MTTTAKGATEMTDQSITTTDSEGREWLTRDLATSLAGQLADIRDGLEELHARFDRVMDDVRSLPGGEPQWQRVDAYPGTRLDRDMGAGKGPIEWIEEVGTFLERLADGEGDL